MTCDQRKDLLLLYAADALDADERQTLREHLATGCPACAGHLAEAAAVLSQLPLGLELQNPPPEAKNRLFARIESDRSLADRAARFPSAPSATGSTFPQRGAARPAPPGFATAPLDDDAGRHAGDPAESPIPPIHANSNASRPPAPRDNPPAPRDSPPAPRDSRPALIWLVLSPAVAAALAVFITHRALSGAADQQRHQIRSLTADVQELNILLQSQSDNLNAQKQSAARLQLALDDQLRWSLQPSFPLAGAPAQPAATGRVYRNPAANQWELLAANLKPAPPGKTYELWFVPAAGKPVRAATFDPDASGLAQITVDVPQNIGPIAKAAVTDEPSGGTDQPTGSFQILGAVQ